MNIFDIKFCDFGMKVFTPHKNNTQKSTSDPVQTTILKNFFRCDEILLHGFLQLFFLLCFVPLSPKKINFLNIAAQKQNVAFSRKAKIR